MKRVLWLLSGGLLSSLMLAVMSVSVEASGRPVLPDSEAEQLAMRTNWQNASFPVENFQTYSSLFGYRQFTPNARREFHAGLDLAAPKGSYIRSWLAGRVISVSDNSACGTSVKIASGNWTHVYCHLEGRVVNSAQGRYISDRQGGLQIREGQQVQAGTRIGRVGMTGRTTGPHLHWGLQYNSQWVNPALILDSMYNQQQVSFRPGSSRF